MNKENELVQTLVAFNNKYCGLKGEILDLLSIFHIYVFGHKNFDHATHISIASPDDFINNRLGKINEDLCFDTYATNFADISALTRAREKKEIELGIIYVYQKLRASVQYGRLCQTLRTGNLPCIIIGNSRFIDPYFLPNTIPIYIPPTLSPLMRYQPTSEIKEIGKIRNLIPAFWEKNEAAILEKYRNLQTPAWLINSEEDSWPRLLAITEVLDPLLDRAVYTKSILTLAERIIKSRKRDESSIPLEVKVLQATEVFIDKNDPMEGSEFYYGPQLFSFVRESLNLPNLRSEKISEYLNKHEGIVIDTCRPKEKEGKKIIQHTCYQFNKEQLSQTIKNMS